MNRLCRITALALALGTAAFAAEPLVGTWKLNRERSKTNGPLPSFMHDDAMTFRPGGAMPSVPPSHFVVVDPSGAKNMYRVDVSPDLRILTMTRVRSFDDQTARDGVSLVLEKQ